MGKTHEDSVRELAAKTPWTVGEAHDAVYAIKQALKPLIRDGVEWVRGERSWWELIGAVHQLRGLRELLADIPEPTVELCQNENAKRLCRMRDEFFEHLELPSYEPIFRAIIDAVIILYEYDPPYRYWFDWWLEQVIAMANLSEWTPRKAGTPTRWWKENLHGPAD